MGQFAQEIRSLFDKPYRRAFRNLRHLPLVDYRFVIDAGANRGAFTDAFLRLHRPERVVLVEAIPDLAMKLQGRYEGDPRISVVSAALSDQNGEAQFEINKSEASSSLLPIDPRNSEWFGRDLGVATSIPVLTLTLPELMKRQQLERVDLLKLDLQGAERLVLSGCAEVLESGPSHLHRSFLRAALLGRLAFLGNERISRRSRIQALRLIEHRSRRGR